MSVCFQTRDFCGITASCTLFSIHARCSPEKRAPLDHTQSKYGYVFHKSEMFRWNSDGRQPSGVILFARIPSRTSRIIRLVAYKQHEPCMQGPYIFVLAHVAPELVTNFRKFHWGSGENENENINLSTTIYNISARVFSRMAWACLLLYFSHRPVVPILFVRRNISQSEQRKFIYIYMYHCNM